MATIIGRHKEIAELNDVYKSDKAELCGCVWATKGWQDIPR